MAGYRGVGLEDGAANLVVITGCTDLVGRCLAALIAAFPERTDRLAAYALANALFGGAIFVSGFCRAMWSLGLAAAAFGLGFGLQLSSYAVVMVDLFGVARFPSVFGFASLAGGLGAILFPLAAGAVGDAFQPPAALLLAGSVNVVGALCSGIVWLLRRRRRAAERREEAEEEAQTLQQKDN